MMQVQAFHLLLFLKRNGRPLFVVTLLLILILLIQSKTSGGNLDPTLTSLRGDGYKQFGGALRSGTFSVNSAVIVKNQKYHVTAVADLDKRSKTGGKEWYSVLMPGTLERGEDGMYAVEWGEETRVTTKHNEGGRGMELSELTIYDGRLLSFGDRTGIVFEFITDGGATKSVPRFILTEGDGETDKGMKVEWATVKDGNLYIGSFGKEFTNPAGEVVNRNNMWIVVLDHWGHVKRYDWTDIYDKVRNFAGAQAPGYLVHEAVLWSEAKKRWMFLPRRFSRTAYDEVMDESLGTNIMITADASFKTLKMVNINLDAKGMDGLHGFSSFAFVPGTGDQHAVALRSVEENCTGDDDEVCNQRSYVIVFDTDTGEVLMQERMISNTMKFEGIEFVDITH